MQERDAARDVAVRAAGQLERGDLLAAAVERFVVAQQPGVHQLLGDRRRPPAEVADAARAVRVRLRGPERDRALAGRQFDGAQLTCPAPCSITQKARRPFSPR